jgi:hypothetical protein
MQTVNRDTILELIDQSPAVAVSLFMPRYSDSGPQARQDPIRLKNLLSQAEDELRALDMELREAEALLQPLRAEIDDAGFWKQGSAGLVAYLAPGFKRIYHVNQKLEEMLVVDTQFAVLPLVCSMADSARYYILDLSESHNRLILVENGAATEIEIAGAPANLNESMRLEDREHQQQLHSASSAAVGAASFHGGGSWNDYEKEQIPLYCKQINDALVTMLSEDRAPLLLAAEERIASFYQSANSYPYLIDKPIFGNYQDSTVQALATEAWPLAEPHVIQGAQDKLARMEDVKNTEKGVVDPVQVLDAALNGRIDTLFLNPQAELWGVVDPSTQQVTVHKQRSGKSNDLLELAVRETLRNAGLVLTLEAGKMPAKTPVAALLRWPGGTSTLRI